MRHELVGRPMEILLIEDSLSDAKLAIEALRAGRVQHRLTLTTDGIEALGFLRRAGVFHRAPRPDLVLLDLNLPRLDGREVLAGMRADEVLRDIPVVVLTASAGDEEVLRSELDVDAYMIKPVNMPKFLEIVRQLRHRWLADVILPEAV